MYKILLICLTLMLNACVVATPYGHYSHGGYNGYYQQPYYSNRYYRQPYYNNSSRYGNRGGYYGGHSHHHH